jgi:hypothetical protein
MSSLSRTASACNAKSAINSTHQASLSNILSIANKELVPSALQVVLWLLYLCQDVKVREFLRHLPKSTSKFKRRNRNFKLK